MPREVPSSKRKRPPVVFIDTPAKARAAMDELFKHAYQEGKPTAMDTEFQPRTNEPVLMSYSWDEGIRRVVEGNLIVEFYGDWLSDSETRITYQNYKADAGVVKTLGVDTEASFYDDIMVTGVLRDETLLHHGLKAQAAHWLHDPAHPDRPWRRQEYAKLFAYVPAGKKKPIMMSPKEVMYALPPDALVQAVLEWRGKEPVVGPRTRDQWRQVMLDYSGDDAESTGLLGRSHRRYLRKIGYWNEYLRVDREFTLTLMQCERHGVLLDQLHLKRILRKQDVRILQAEHAFRVASGNPKLNLRSGPQMQKLLLEDWGWPVRDDLVNPPGKKEIALAAEEGREPRGAPKLDAEAMHWWATEHDFEMARVKLDFNNASTLKGTFLTGLLTGVSKADGRLRSDLNQIGAKASGRISSRKFEVEVEVSRTLKSGEVKTSTQVKKAGANLQNIPSRKEKDPFGIRKAFVAPKKGQMNAHGEIADEDHVLVVADESGFELLMVIHWVTQIMQKSAMFDLMIRYGSPSAVHAYTSIQVFGDTVHRCSDRCVDAKTREYKKGHKAGFSLKQSELSMDDWHLVKVLFPDSYSTSKNCNFGLAYLGSWVTLARLRGQDARDERVKRDNQRIVDDWYATYPEVTEYQNHMIDHGYQKGWVPTIGGRRGNVKARLQGLDLTGRRIRDDKEREAMIKYGERCCTNIPAQGSAADIIKDAMNRIRKNPSLQELKAASLFPVHDEVVLECRRSVADEVLDIQCHEMKQPYRGKMKFGLVVEGGYGPDWVSAKP